MKLEAIGEVVVHEDQEIPFGISNGIGGGFPHDDSTQAGGLRAC